MSKLCLFFVVLIASLPVSGKGSVPKFRMQDQKGKVFTSESAKGKTLFLLGCGFKDVILCRKHGRKIYWKMQTLLKDEDTVEFLAYLDLHAAPETVHDYISGERDKDYESILLDTKGDLSQGLKDGSSYLRVYSRTGTILHEEYFTNVDDSVVLRLFEFVKADRIRRKAS
ncbi:hypothetical protein EHO60_05375 [Leptospira fletcheri]|uniref:Uncharacterized protein n=1 Tax=Leptospira fletcheri TaxID=2484981 RepID=A0A4R9GGH5_9LEPT|nr:hypothetical protein [Leptospira fletcheri]TGK11727.1 hypothetical protein EHO60_05375 [Leptospira fletcheri]